MYIYVHYVCEISVHILRAEYIYQNTHIPFENVPKMLTLSAKLYHPPKSGWKFSHLKLSINIYGYLWTYWYVAFCYGQLR